MTKNEFEEMLKECLEESLSIDISTHVGWGYGDESKMKIEVKYEDKVVCSDYIYLSSLQKD